MEVRENEIHSVKKNVTQPTLKARIKGIEFFFSIKFLHIKPRNTSLLQVYNQTICF